MFERPFLAIVFAAAILHSTPAVTASADETTLPQFETQYLAAIQSFFGCPALDLDLSKLQDSFRCSDVHIELKKIESPAPRGTILKQIPAAGSVLGELKQIYFRVSDGLEVPNVVNLSLRAAQEILSKRSIPFLHQATEIHLGIPAGRVVHQVPTPSSRLDASRHVLFLNVSKSPGVRVPDLRGLTLKAAKKRLRSYGLSLLGYNSLPPSHYPLCGRSIWYFYGKVRSTKPSRGTYVMPGSTLYLSVSVHEQTGNEPCYRGRPL